MRRHIVRPLPACRAGFLAAAIAIFAVTQAVGEQACRPSLAFKEVQLSEMKWPTLERKWTAVLSVDASRCRTESGPFEIGLVRLSETATDLAFEERFTWRPNAVEISLDLWADEAIGRYWIKDISPCPCRD